jgi:UDP-3-O-[3-hydroxymyristoyl] glucosamine N-acyltransferase
MPHKLVVEKGGRIAKSSYIGKNTKLEVPVDIADNCTIYSNVKIQKFSYVNVGCVIYHKVNIGKFCSIDRSCEIGLAEHPIDFLSTHPFQFAETLFMRNPEYASISRVEHKFHKETAIGNDVWIGAKVLIQGGGNNRKWSYYCCW